MTMGHRTIITFWNVLFLALVTQLTMAYRLSGSEEFAAYPENNEYQMLSNMNHIEKRKIIEFAKEILPRRPIKLPDAVSPSRFFHVYGRKRRDTKAKRQNENLNFNVAVLKSKIIRPSS
ncbi:uncharacterized protein LOC135498161 [Lineus longissimus]|uniref:uncharacterized protein LOC135498161 n=1 Tax=Lineus longissimus TaxID=88925 RepID=UPI002B4F12B0